MNTVLLRWNPEISSMTYQRHADGIANFYNEDFNWSIWEHQLVHDDDRFLMLCCGGDKHGIVMSGTISSMPYRDQSWRGDGKMIYYCDILPDVIIDPLAAPILTSETLYREIPEFDWDHGHAGIVLDEDIALRLEVLWLQFLYNHPHIFDEKAAIADGNLYEDLPATLQHHLQQSRGGTCELCGYNYQHIFGADCPTLPSYHLLEPYDEKGHSHNDPLDGMHCLCDNCFDQLLHISNSSNKPLAPQFYQLIRKKP